MESRNKRSSNSTFESSDKIQKLSTNEKERYEKRVKSNSLIF